MIYELTPRHYGLVAPLYRDAWERSAVQSVLSGRRTDRCSVYADDPAAPTAALVAHVGNYMLGGDPSMAMLRFIMDAPAESDLFSAGYYAFYAMKDTWEAALTHIAHPDVKITQRKALRRELDTLHDLPDWRAMLPSNASVLPLDAALAKQVDRELEEQWIGALFTDQHEQWDRYPMRGYTLFIEKSFGVVLLLNGKVASVFWAFGISDSAASVEVETAAGVRGRGLATMAGWAWLEACRQRGVSSEWIADSDNIPSLRLAARLGHTLLKDVRKFVWRTWDQSVTLKYGDWRRDVCAVGWEWKRNETP